MEGGRRNGGSRKQQADGVGTGWDLRWCDRRGRGVRHPRQTCCSERMCVGTWTRLLESTGQHVARVD
eukprot:360268-Rhodomonas_salina.4